MGRCFVDYVLKLTLCRFPVLCRTRKFPWNPITTFWVFCKQLWHTHTHTHTHTERERQTDRQTDGRTDIKYGMGPCQKNRHARTGHLHTFWHSQIRDNNNLWKGGQAHTHPWSTSTKSCVVSLLSAICSLLSALLLPLCINNKNTLLYLEGHLLRSQFRRNTQKWQTSRRIGLLNCLIVSAFYCGLHAM